MAQSSSSLKMRNRHYALKQQLKATQPAATTCSKNMTAAKRIVETPADEDALFKYTYVRRSSHQASRKYPSHFLLNSKNPQRKY